jgi:hypothetical protein
MNAPEPEKSSGPGAFSSRLESADHRVSMERT